jgi:hypothetical protein
MVSKFLSGYNLDQLNTIPEGFNNNLIWNIGHIIVSQQLLVYKLSVCRWWWWIGREIQRNQPQCNGRWSWGTQSFVVFHHSANQVRLRCKLFQTTSTPPQQGIMSWKCAEDAMASNFHEGFTLVLCNYSSYDLFLYWEFFPSYVTISYQTLFSKS